MVEQKSMAMALGVWCVPSPTKTLYIHQSQKTVLAPECWLPCFCNLPSLTLSNSQEQSSSASKKSQYFMKPKGSSPHSQKPTISPYPEPDTVHAHPILFLKVHLNINLPTMLRSSKWPPQLCHVHCPYHCPWSEHLKNIWRGVYTTKLLIMQSSHSPVTS
jgi:hypothetical protein